MYTWPWLASSVHKTLAVIAITAHLGPRPAAAQQVAQATPVPSLHCQLQLAFVGRLHVVAHGLNLGRGAEQSGVEEQSGEFMHVS